MEPSLGHGRGGSLHAHRGGKHSITAVPARRPLPSAPAGQVLSMAKLGDNSLHENNSHVGNPHVERCPCTPWVSAARTMTTTRTTAMESLSDPCGLRVRPLGV